MEFNEKNICNDNEKQYNILSISEFCKFNDKIKKRNFLNDILKFTIKINKDKSILLQAIIKKDMYCWKIRIDKYLNMVKSLLNIHVLNIFLYENMYIVKLNEFIIEKDYTYIQLIIYNESDLDNSYYSKKDLNLKLKLNEKEYENEKIMNESNNDIQEYLASIERKTINFKSSLNDDNSCYKLEFLSDSEFESFLSHFINKNNKITHYYSQNIKKDNFLINQGKECSNTLFSYITKSKSSYVNISNTIEICNFNENLKDYQNNISNGCNKNCNYFETINSNLKLSKSYNYSNILSESVIRNYKENIMKYNNKNTSEKIFYSLQL